MSLTKMEFINLAFEEIGLAHYVFDLQAEQLQMSLRRMDAMMATWNGKGIRVGYPLPSSPATSDIDVATDVPDSANEAIYLNLAVRIAGAVGKVVSMETKANAKAAYNVLLLRAAKPVEMQLPGSMPAGAGTKRIERPFLNKPKDPLLVGGDGELELY